MQPTWCKTSFALRPNASINYAIQIDSNPGYMQFFATRSIGVPKSASAQHPPTSNQKRFLRWLPLLIPMLKVPLLLLTSSPNSFGQPQPALMNEIDLCLNYQCDRASLVPTLQTLSEFRPSRVTRLFIACATELKRVSARSLWPRWVAKTAKNLPQSFRVGTANSVFSFVNESHAILMSVQSVKRLVQSTHRLRFSVSPLPSCCPLVCARRCWQQRSQFPSRRNQPMPIQTKFHVVHSVQNTSSSIATMDSHSHHEPHDTRWRSSRQQPPSSYSLPVSFFYNKTMIRAMQRPPAQSLLIQLNPSRIQLQIQRMIQRMIQRQL